MLSLDTGSPAFAGSPRSFRGWLISWFYRRALDLHELWIAVLQGLRGIPTPTPHAKTILLTGTFYSENWILNHLRPLAASRGCRRVFLVTTFPVPAVDGVTIVAPAGWMRAALGEVPARLLQFVVEAIRRRPDIVGGFHLLPNGLVAASVARAIGASSLYFCGGGQREVLGGGYYSGTRSFSLLEGPDQVLQNKLIRALNRIDVIVTMGRGAQRFFRDAGVRSTIEVVPGGIDAHSFEWVESEKTYDVLLVGRLHPIKRIDLFLKSVHLLSQRLPTATAAIVGGGELESPLKALAEQLGIANRVTFAGPQTDVASWLRRSRVFVLTSESEGLSLALMEAMTAGLPCVVSNVGELGELVEHGRSGFLVDDASAESFSHFLEILLTQPHLEKEFSTRARVAASRLTISNTAQAWDRILGS